MNDFITEFFDDLNKCNFDDFGGKSAAANQRYQDALGLLYRMGCQYSINDTDMRLLCDHCGVYWDDLLNHKLTSSTNSTKSNICQLPQ